MDRQHPRDLFDVRGLFERNGLTVEVVECVDRYLAGHNRPAHEVLFSHDQEPVQVIAELRCAGNAPDARRRADGDSGEDESENAADGVFAAYLRGGTSFARPPRRGILGVSSSPDTRQVLFDPRQNPCLDIRFIHFRR